MGRRSQTTIDNGIHTLPPHGEKSLRSFGLVVHLQHDMPGRLFKDRSPWITRQNIPFLVAPPLAPCSHRRDRQTSRSDSIEFAPWK